jgi:hypothetical protein
MFWGSERGYLKKRLYFLGKREGLFKKSFSYQLFKVIICSGGVTGHFKVVHE